MFNSQLFLRSILKKYYALLNNIETNNVDKNQFRDENQWSFNEGLHAAYMQFFIHNYEKLYSTFLILRNDESRKLFIDLILFRLLGHRHVRVKEKAWKHLTGIRDQLKTYEKSDSHFDMEFNGYRFKHYENIPYKDNFFSIDTIPDPLITQFFKHQYDYQSGEISIKVEKGDVAIDAGACIGDTCLRFALLTGDQGRVFGFDPIPQHIKLARHNIKQNQLDNIAEILPYGVDKQSNKVTLLNESTGKNLLEPSFSAERSGIEIPTISIDDFVSDRKLARLDFIKMDIEGCELDALIGALKSIRKFHPKLAISLYHKNEDFFTIPQLLRAEFPFYTFYLDHYTIHAYETVLYAIDHHRKR